MQTQISVTTPVHQKVEYFEKPDIHHKADVVPAVKTAKNESSASDAVQKNTYQTDKKPEKTPDDMRAKNQSQNMSAMETPKKDTAIVANKYVQVEMSEIAKAEKFFPPVPITEIKAPQTPYKNVYIVQKNEQTDTVDKSNTPEKSESLQAENIKSAVQNVPQNSAQNNDTSYGIQK